MRKGILHISTVLVGVALLLSYEIATFAAMPAGAPRTQKDRGNALSRFIADMEGRIGKVDGKIKRTVGKGAAGLCDIAGHGVAELCKAIGHGSAKLCEKVCQFFSGDAEDARKFRKDSYTKVLRELRGRGNKPQKIRRSRRYAPFYRSRRYGPSHPQQGTTHH